MASTVEFKTVKRNKDEKFCSLKKKKLWVKCGVCRRVLHLNYTTNERTRSYENSGHERKK